jgi:sulfatase-like protein
MNPRPRRVLALLLGVGLPIAALLLLAGRDQKRGAQAGAGRAPATAPAHPPVVMIAFDEFSTTSLLDARGRVDPVRYPSFARLARDSYWFPNDTASVDETGRAMETILTGNTPARDHPATYAANPRNVFTLLARHYRVDASEEVTSLCPRRVCPRVRRQTRPRVLRELAGGRAERFERWVRSIGRSGRPTFYFKHVLLPHVPVRYLPSGRHYASGPHEVIPGVLEEFHNRWLIEQAYQRHLLQVGFTDRLLGSVLRRLRKAGLYDKSLIVVTADNGESFGRVGDRHVITSRNAEDIAVTPLFIKAPYQRRGRIVRRHVRTVDILPTIAHVLHLRLPWPTQGRSALGPAARHIPSAVRLSERSGGRVAMSLPTFRRKARSALRRKLRLFGSGDGPPGLYGIGPDPALLATPVALLGVAKRGRVRAVVHDRAALLSVRLGSDFVPTEITGRLLGRGATNPRDIVVAVNGRVAATCRSFPVPGTHREAFSAMVPESVLREGRNQVAVFSVARGRSGLRLRRLGAT